MNLAAIRALIIAAIVVFSLWYGLGFLMPLMFPDLERSGQFGDGFGSVNALFSGLGFIALTYTIILQVESIREIKKQREASYRPELYLGPKNVWVYFKETNHSDFILSENKHSDKATNFSDFKLDIYNLGMGAAKAIDFEWDFDRKKILKMFVSVDQRGYCQIEDRDSSVELKIPSLRFNTTIMMGGLRNTFDTNFILPSNLDLSPTELNTPHLYDLLYVVYNCCLIYNSDLEIQIGDFPPLVLKVNYLDVENNKFEKKFILKYKFHFMTAPSADFNESFFQFSVISKELING